MKRDFLTLRDITAEELRWVLERAKLYKALRRAGSCLPVLQGKVITLIFEKPSSRTKVSFMSGIYRMGGHCIFFTDSEVQMRRREPIKDVARVCGNVTEALVVRTFAHEDLKVLSQYSPVPVINALSDDFHPCQVVADLMTIEEVKGDVSKIRLAYVGDGNNMANSMLNAASLLGFELTMACPEGFEPREEVHAQAVEDTARRSGRIDLGRDPAAALAQADIVYTDAWTSMGQEEEAAARTPHFRDYQVNEQLLQNAPPGCLVMHDLPAHRGEEITDEVLEGPRSLAFRQAENRMYAQQAILELIVCGIPPSE